MAEFLDAYKKSMKHEGGYAKVKGDNGGETYGGISRKYWPKWDGWEIVDKHKPLKNGEIINDTELESRKRRFYKREFWDKVQGDYITYQNAAFQIFDMAINSGPEAAVKIAQRDLGIPDTGKMDSTTLNLINQS